VLGPALRAGRLSVLGVLLQFAAPAHAQERGANALGEAVETLGVTTRVLLIGAHPDDEDTFLIAWLSRGRHVETAYLSLTRGDGGQNLIGNELGEALGVIRTEELLAARRVDGAQQYFTRAFDFGFSKDTIDTYRHWPRDSILGDVIRVVRAFRPHVIFAVFSGTPRDGHGHHQVSGLLAREAYRVAGDTVRFPVARFGPAWTPLKLYGNARYDPAGGETLRFDVGEYSPLLGRSYAEIAGESRSQHKSQGFGAPQRKGPVFDMVRREASRVNENVAATSERSIFDGLDTSLTRFRGELPTPRPGAHTDSLYFAIDLAKAAFDAREPRRMLPSLARVTRLLNEATRTARTDTAQEALATVLRQVNRTMALASGVEMEAFAPREVYGVGTRGRAVVFTYNRGRDTVFVTVPRVRWSDAFEGSLRPLAPGSVLSDTIEFSPSRISQPWWLERPRQGDVFAPSPYVVTSETDDGDKMAVAARVALRDQRTSFRVVAPIVLRAVDPVRGEIRRNVAAAPAVSVAVDQSIQFAPANADFTRELVVQLRSADTLPRDVRVRLTLPSGLTADSMTRSARLGGYDAAQSIAFHLRGRLAAGQHTVRVVAESNGETFASGYQLIDYDHIRRQRLYRAATTTISAVEMSVPRTLRVAYVTGVGDNVAPTLAQLGIPVTIIPAAEIARADLQPYTTVVIGPRAYEAHPELVAANPRLFDFARGGGTLVVQYGQYEMTQPGVMPYPITLVRPADRVTEEDSPVAIDAPDDKLLRTPNRIGPADFANWVQERALYMPRTIDPRYRTLLSMHDTGEPSNKGAILVAPLGAGVYVYTTMSLFRQLPAGIPGGARLFLNLLTAGMPSANLNP